MDKVIDFEEKKNEKRDAEFKRIQSECIRSVSEILDKNRSIVRPDESGEDVFISIIGSMFLSCFKTYCLLNKIGTIDASRMILSHNLETIKHMTNGDISEELEKDFGAVPYDIEDLRALMALNMINERSDILFPEETKH